MAHALRQSTLMLVLLGVLGTVTACDSQTPGGAPGGADGPTGARTSLTSLPAPRTSGSMSVEEALSRRRSVREYTPGALRLDEVSQLLWAAQGVTAAGGGRTAPSAGALYPLDVLLVVGDVDGLAPGVYRYLPAPHAVVRLVEGDVRDDLAEAALGQDPVRDAAASVVIAGVYSRTTGKYGDRGVRFVDMEAGHAAQNVCLQAVASGLGTVTIGALTEDRSRSVLGLAPDETPLYVLPVGRVG